MLTLSLSRNEIIVLRDSKTKKVIAKIMRPLPPIKGANKFSFDAPKEVEIIREKRC